MKVKAVVKVFQYIFHGRFWIKLSVTEFTRLTVNKLQCKQKIMSLYIYNRWTICNTVRNKCNNSRKMTYQSQWVLFLVRIPQWYISYVQPNKNLLSLWRDTNRSETLTPAQLTVCFTHLIDGEMIQIQTQSLCFSLHVSCVWLLCIKVLWNTISYVAVVICRCQCLWRILL